MGYLEIMTESEYLAAQDTIEYPTVVWVNHPEKPFIRFTPPPGYQFLDTSTEC